MSYDNRPFIFLPLADQVGEICIRVDRINAFWTEPATGLTILCFDYVQRKVPFKTKISVSDLRDLIKQAWESHERAEHARGIEIARLRGGSDK